MKPSSKEPEMAAKKLFTLVFLKQNNTVLLGHKTRGLGEGLWNGFGGKLEQNESIAACAIREVKEECNLVLEKIKHIGVVRYDVVDQNYTHIVHIFTSNKFKGTETPSEEMNPVTWYKFKDIPFDKMWPDAQLWYPIMLKELFFSAVVTYEGGIISKYCIQEHCSIKNALEIVQEGNATH